MIPGMNAGRAADRAASDVRDQNAGGGNTVPFGRVVAMGMSQPWSERVFFWSSEQSFHGLVSRESRKDVCENSETTESCRCVDFGGRMEYVCYNLNAQVRLPSPVSTATLAEEAIHGINH